MKRKGRRMTYAVKKVCQGELMGVREFRHLIPAVWCYMRLVKKHGKFGTMLIKLEGW